MITIISGTNRKNSGALQFAQYYKKIIATRTDEPVKLLALEEIPHDWFHPDMYSKGKISRSLVDIQDAFILPATKFLFVIPEYNGGFPGVLKLFIDACSVRKYAENFQGKKAALAGIASGRAGNLRGMDHLTGILHYLGAVVMPNKLPISSINKLTDDEGNLVDKETIGVIEKHVEEFLAF
jgi:NAD(P)H-dependent FMN reductase